MPVKRCVLVCAFNLLCVCFGYAQTQAAYVHGYVKSIGNQPVNLCSVYLLKTADSSVVKFTTTNKQGWFKVDIVAAGSYLVKVTAVGYKAAMFKPVYFKNATIDLGEVHLIPANHKLNDVAILADRSSFIETKADKTTLNIRSSTLMIGSNALEVLAKSPGVQIDNDDNISLNGRSDAMVMIDDKPTYLSGSSLAELLRGMQSSMIDKIELISNPNAGYDASGTGGVINIRTVRDKNVGFNAQLIGGWGFAQFPDNRFTGVRNSAGINFNYRTKKLNIFGGYTFINTPAYRSIVSQRKDVYQNHVDDIDVSLYLNQRRVSNSYRLGADYSIGKKQTLGFLISDIITDLDGPKYNTSTVSNQGSLDSTTVTNSMLHRRQSNIAYNLNYRIGFNSSSALTINADRVCYNRDYNENFQSNYYYPPNTVPYRSLQLQNISPSNFDLYVGSANYHVATKANEFTAGIKVSDIKTSNESNFGSITDNVYRAYANFSGTFKYSERLNAAFVDYLHQFNKKTNMELGLRTEQTISRGTTSNTGEDIKNNYVDFFPNVKFNHTINDNNQLQLGYGRRISRPKYEDLNPLVLYQDQYTYQIGNQYLKPFYSNLIELKHVYKDKYVTSLSFEAVNGFTQVVYMQSDQSQLSRLTKKNLGNRYNYALHFIAPFTITKWYSADVDVNALYQRFKSTNNADLDAGGPDAYIRLIQRFKLPLSIQADLGGYYDIPTTFGIYRYKAQYYAWGGLTKSVLKKQGNIHLQVDGVFNSDKNVQTTHYQNLNLSATQINNSRTVTLSFTYGFGSKTIKAAPKKDTDAEEEQGRVGTGAN